MEIGTEFKFEAAHRMLNDSGPCGKLHGHNWKVKITISGEPNYENDMLVDFNDLKAVIEQFDHRTILNSDDVVLGDYLIGNEFARVIYLTRSNPTCETLARLIHAEIIDKLGQIDYMNVTVFENDVSYATYEDWYEVD